MECAPILEKRGFEMLIRWHQKEIDFCVERVGYLPIEKIEQGLSNFNKRNGFPVRTKKAIERKMNNLGYRLKPIEDGVTASELSRLLGVSRDSVLTWIYTHGLPAYRRKNSKHFCCYLSEVKEWALQNQERLYGLDCMNLFYLLGDKKLAKELSSRIKPHQKKVVVRNLTKNVTFQDAREAAKSAYLQRDGLYWHIRQGKTRFVAGGFEWQVIN